MGRWKNIALAMMRHIPSASSRARRDSTKTGDEGKGPSAWSVFEKANRFVVTERTPLSSTLRLDPDMYEFTFSQEQRT